MALIFTESEPVFALSQLFEIFGCKDNLLIVFYEKKACTKTRKSILRRKEHIDAY